MFEWDEEFRFPSLFRDFERFFEDARNSGGKSFYWGYSRTVGSDGKPIVSEFSNIPGFKVLDYDSFAPKCIEADADGGCAEIEPYHDVLDSVDSLKVIVDLPGVDKKDIKLSTVGRTIELSAKGDSRSYRKVIKLNDFVGGLPERAQYKNGVLEIIYKKTDKPYDIRVE